jgi:hypothetical protein
LIGYLGLSGLIGGFGSCSSAILAPPSSLDAGPSRATTGRTRDIDAAVSFALRQIEFAPVQNSEPEPGTRLWELVNARGEPGWLRIKHPPPPGSDSGSPEALAMVQVPSSMTISASLGRFGNAELEQRLIDAVRDRLRELDERGY